MVRNGTIQEALIFVVSSLLVMVMSNILKQGMLKHLRIPTFHGWKRLCGGATIVSNGNSYTNARTAVGYSFNGETLYFLTVDENHGSTGMNMTQLGVEMQNLGADFAIGLGGGGSTTMWTESLGLVNTPKGSTQRTVSNHLGVWIEGGAQGYNCPQ